jgi:hypothetical protein
MVIARKIAARRTDAGVYSPMVTITRDQDVHKGAWEDDSPDPERLDAPGLDHDGLPNDFVAIAQDVLGAENDNSQG